MLVWEGDQKHLPPFIIQTSSKRERREEGVEREEREKKRVKRRGKRQESRGKRGEERRG